MPLGMKLSSYENAVTSALEKLGYSVHFWTRVYRAGKNHEPAVKLRFCPNTETEMTPDTCSVMKDKNILAAVAKELAKNGLTVVRTRNSIFDWGRGGMCDPAVTFYFESDPFVR